MQEQSISLVRRNVGIVDDCRSPIRATVAFSLRQIYNRYRKPIVGTKDGSGLVMGDIAVGPRKNNNVASISFLALDIEEPGPAYRTDGHRSEIPPSFDDAKSLLEKLGLACIIHTTYSHTPQSPRYRIIFVPTESLEPARMKAAVAYAAKLTGLERCYDRACSDPARLFYEPRCAEARLADYKCAMLDGSALEIPLAEPACLPDRQVASPGRDSGPIGDFNAAHSVEDILAVHGYLPTACLSADMGQAGIAGADLPLPTGQAGTGQAGGKRWLWPGSKTGMPGVRLLDNGLIYSSHNGDPLCNGHAHDAFSLYTILDHGGDFKAAIKALDHATSAPSAPSATSATSARANAGKPSDEPSEDDLAMEFIGLHDDLRYVEPHGYWRRWDGKRWRIDDTGHTLSDVRDFLRARGGLPPSKRSARTIAAVEKLSRYDRRAAATLEQWDRDDWALNTGGGIVDLRAGTIGSHRKDAYATMITGAAPSAGCPLWDAFLAKITSGNAELSKFLQRAVGYGLSGSTREHALFFCYGTGANGKSVFLNTVKAVCGDYATVAPMQTFAESHSEQHPTELAALMGARIVISQETSEGKSWADGKIKALTGGDRISARFMRRDFFSYQPKFKLFIAGNHKPRLRASDESVRRRLHLIPFTVTVPAAERDKDLAEKLSAEWPGILQWMLDGLEAYLVQGLDPPPIVAGATAEYFSGEDLFAQWLEDCCELGEQCWETPTRLFTSWKDYAARANDRPGRQRELNEKLAANGFRYVRNNARGRHWLGLKVIQMPETPQEWQD
jgi:P4 family phage/plasmid primase-like protien